MLYAGGASCASIIIDPGHSPKTPGAISCDGIPEYRFNNTLAMTIAKHLAGNGFSVQLTKPIDGEMPLAERVVSSNGHGLLLSIHHDSVQPQFISKVQGRKGACSNKASGFSIFLSRHNSRYEESLDYARRLGSALIARGLRPTLHHAEPIAGENRKLLVPELGIYLFDELTVLKKTKVPALLFEAAVIVNPADEARAVEPAYQTLIAEAVAAMMKQ